jgi:hypothetical protein
MYKCSSFKKHKMLNLLSILLAIKINLLFYYAHLLHKFIIQILDCPFVIQYLLFNWGFFPQILRNILNCQTKLYLFLSFLEHIVHY